MKNPGDGLNGLTEPSDSMDVSEIDSEKIEDLKEIVVVERLAERRKEKSFERVFTGCVVFGCIGTLACLIVIGLFRNDFSGAKEWWAAVGAIVGYLSRSIFERPQQKA